ncbi:MAG: hypothetical protein Q8N34_03290 [Gammaproteobacteria bacterium]|nr:hypothetical protein [Gammaproteobacteria bacterium]
MTDTSEEDIKINVGVSKGSGSLAGGTGKIDGEQFTIVEVDSAPKSIRPAEVEPQRNGGWFMKVKNNGKLALCDHNGTEMLELFEPLHDDEIQTLRDAFTKTSLDSLAHGRRQERQRIQQMFQLLNQ